MCTGCYTDCGHNDVPWEKVRSKEREIVWQHRERGTTVIVRLEAIPYAPQEVLDKDPRIGKEKTWNVWVTDPTQEMKVYPFFNRVEAIKGAIVRMKEIDEAEHDK